MYDGTIEWLDHDLFFCVFWVYLASRKEYCVRFALIKGYTVHERDQGIKARQILMESPSIQMKS
jgi:hypothetical protein